MALPFLVDSHCHLDFPDFDAEREAVEALDVFQNCEARLLRFQDSYHLEEQTVLAEARAVARDGKALTWEARREDVVVRHVVGVDLRDVAVRHVPEIRRVGRTRVRVDFRGEDRLASERLEGHAEPAEAREQLGEAEISFGPGSAGLGRSQQIDRAISLLSARAAAPARADA